MYYYSRIRISVQSQKVNLRLRGFLQFALLVQRQPRAVRILVGVQQHVRPIVFVVT